MKKIKLKQTFACDEDWDSMAGDHRQRHCAACDRNIVDLSAMSESKAHAYVTGVLNSGEQLCAAFRVDGNRIVFAPEPAAKPRKALAAAALTLGLSFGCDGVEPAERPIAVEAQTESVEPAKGAAKIPIAQPKTPAPPPELSPEERKAQLDARNANARSVISDAFDIRLEDRENVPESELRQIQENRKKRIERRNRPRPFIGIIGDRE